MENTWGKGRPLFPLSFSLPPSLPPPPPHCIWDLSNANVMLPACSQPPSSYSPAAPLSSTTHQRGHLGTSNQIDPNCFQTLAWFLYLTQIWHLGACVFAVLCMQVWWEARPLNHSPELQNKPNATNSTNSRKIWGSINLISKDWFQGRIVLAFLKIYIYRVKTTLSL